MVKLNDNVSTFLPYIRTQKQKWSFAMFLFIRLALWQTIN